MRLLRKLTNKEWKEIGEKYKDGGVHMYRGKKTFFWNGETLFDEDTLEPYVYNNDERETWEVIIVLPGVKVIPPSTFILCWNVKTIMMADTVKRIEKYAFAHCSSLEFVKLSRNLEYIGDGAFLDCKSLTSIFIPSSCREIGSIALCGCHQLIIFSIPQNIQVGRNVFHKTALIKKSPFVNRHGYYDRNDENEVVRWVKSINDGEAYALHRACASFNPLADIIHDLVKRQSIKAMKMTNAIGITPSQYLEANTFADISEKEIINRYILDSMGEKKLELSLDNLLDQLEDEKGDNLLAALVRYTDIRYDDVQVSGSANAVSSQSYDLLKKIVDYLKQNNNTRPLLKQNKKYENVAAVAAKCGSHALGSANVKSPLDFAKETQTTILNNLNGKGGTLVDFENAGICGCEEYVNCKSAMKSWKISIEQCIELLRNSSNSIPCDLELIQKYRQLEMKTRNIKNAIRDILESGNHHPKKLIAKLIRDPQDPCHRAALSLTAHFAAEDIPADTIICEYAGEVRYDDEGHGVYEVIPEYAVKLETFS